MKNSDLDSLRARLRTHEPRQLPEDGGMRAAVAIIVRTAQPELEALLIRRAEHPTDPWSGHMAFPGGRWTSADADLTRTAVRETCEEVGLDLDRWATLLGRIDDVQAVALGRPVGMIITPFVFELHDRSNELSLGPEVAEAIWAPLGPLVRRELDGTHSYTRDGRVYTLPAYLIEQRVVWGLTYRMLQTFFATLADGDDLKVEGPPPSRDTKPK